MMLVFLIGLFFLEIGKLYARKANFKYKERWKFWIPIFGVNKKNCLRVIKNSHQDEIDLVYEKVNKYLKPTIPKSYIRKNNKKIVVPLKNSMGMKVCFSTMIQFILVQKIFHQIVDYQLNLIY